MYAVRFCRENRPLSKELKGGYMKSASAFMRCVRIAIVVGNVLPLMCNAAQPLRGAGPSEPSQEDQGGTTQPSRTAGGAAFEAPLHAPAVSASVDQGWFSTTCMQSGAGNKVVILGEVHYLEKAHPAVEAFKAMKKPLFQVVKGAFDNTATWSKILIETPGNWIYRGQPLLPMGMKLAYLGNPKLSHPKDTSSGLALKLHKMFQKDPALADRILSRIGALEGDTPSEDMLSAMRAIDNRHLPEDEMLYAFGHDQQINKSRDWSMAFHISGALKQSEKNQRVMAIMGISHVNSVVDNLKRSFQFKGIACEGLLL